MKYLLDTNTCIVYINGRSPQVLQRMSTTKPQDIAVCSIVKAELFAGAMKTRSPTQTRAGQQKFLDQLESLFFDDVAADSYARIRADLEVKGTPIGPHDLQIAAIALVHNLILVTHNMREFSRVTGLYIEDWQAPT